VLSFPEFGVPYLSTGPVTLFDGGGQPVGLVQSLEVTFFPPAAPVPADQMDAPTPREQRLVTLRQPQVSSAIGNDQDLEQRQGRRDDRGVRARGNAALRGRDEEHGCPAHVVGSAAANPLMSLRAVDLPTRTPLEAGLRMPGEWVSHARCWMAWPHRADLWGDVLADAQRTYARVARAIAAFEPVTMIAAPEAVAEAARVCTPAIEILPLAIDDSWARDSGPSFLSGPGGCRAATAWRFNAWGGKFERYAEDAQLAPRVCDRLGFACYASPLHLEGGAFHVDGEGTVITTESCALNPNRNPGLTKREVERELCHALGASKVVWLPGAPGEGDITDGHVDGLACFVRPGLVLLETLTGDAATRALLRENRCALEGVTDAKGRPLEVVEMEEAWEAEPESATWCRSFINFYVANGGVVMPAYGVPGDARARAVIEKVYPDRRVVQIDIRRVAIGGGGIHCITQQQPA
jgi:agmatine deiminase